MLGRSRQNGRAAGEASQPLLNNSQDGAHDDDDDVLLSINDDALLESSALDPDQAVPSDKPEHGHVRFQENEWWMRLAGLPWA